MAFEELVEKVARVIEFVGVLVILLGVAWSLVRFVSTFRTPSTPPAYTTLRRSLGRAILVGLEVLVAADIIHTVATAPTFRSLGVLALLIAIRTFLSVEIEMEIEGHWPWQKAGRSGRKDVAGSAGE